MGKLRRGTFNDLILIITKFYWKLYFTRFIEKYALLSSPRYLKTERLSLVLIPTPAFINKNSVINIIFTGCVHLFHAIILLLTKTVKMKCTKLDSALECSWYNYWGNYLKLVHWIGQATADYLAIISLCGFFKMATSRFVWVTETTWRSRRK